MFFDILPYFLSPGAMAAEAFLLGVLLAQKVKDFGSSTPKAFRKSMSAVERKAKTEVQAATSEIFARLNPPTD